MGRSVESEVDLDGLDDLDDPRDERAGELRALVERVGRVGGVGSDLEQGRQSVPYPDGFTYDFDVDGQSSRVFEADLTPDLRRIADLVLRPEEEA